MRIKKLFFLLIISLCLACNSTKVKNEKTTYNITNKNVDTLLVKSKQFDDITILVNKPNFYNSVNTRKFEPLYIFSNNKNLSEKLLNSNIQSPNTAEAFIYIVVDFDFNKTDPKEFKSFLNRNLFPLIEKNYRCFNFRYAIAENKNNNVLSNIVINHNNLFDFYLLIQPNKTTIQNLKNISNLKTETQKSINLIQVADNQSRVGFKSNSELIILNKNVIESNNDNELDKKIKILSFKLINKYNKSISNIEDEFYDDNFTKGDSIINILENYSKLKTKLLTPRNTNRLAYSIQSFGHNELSITIINWAINKFPKNINLFHSKGELYHKIGNKEEALSAYEKFKNIVILNKDNLDKKTYDSYLSLYKKSVDRIK